MVHFYIYKSTFYYGMINGSRVKIVRLYHHSEKFPLYYMYSDVCSSFEAPVATELKAQPPFYKLLPFICIF